MRGVASGGLHAGYPDGEAKAESGASSIGLRSFFEKAGVLVCRPGNAGGARLGAAIKAGGNSSHSHNDIGAFVIALDGALPVGDPGGPHAYNNETFSSKRYTYNILNSFGHPVPVVGGKLQEDATKCAPKVLSTRFTDAEDEIVIDMKPAYAVDGLRVLERRMRYSRAGSGSVVVEDRMEAGKPLDFEIALPTTGTCTRVDGKTLEFTAGKARLRATIECPGLLVFTETAVTELGAPTFRRVGMKLEKPAKSVTVKVTFRPVE